MGAAFQCTLGTGSQVPGVTGTPRSDHGQLMVLMLATLQGCPEGFGWAPGWHFWPTALPSRNGLLLPSVLPEWPPGRTAVSGPPAGAPPATRGGLGSAPPRPLASAPLPICCPHLFADTGPTSADVPVSLHGLPRRSHSRRVSTHKPPPAPRLPWRSPWPSGPGRQPASAFGLSSFCIGGRTLASLSVPAPCQLRAPHPGLGVDPATRQMCSLGKEAAVASSLPCVRQELPQPPAAPFSSCPPRAHFSASVLSVSRCGPCPALSALAPQLVPSSPFLSPGSPDPPSPASSLPTCLPLTPPPSPRLLASYSLFFAGFPVHGVRGAPARRPHSTPLPARPAGRPHLPAPAQTRLRPGQLVGLPRVDTWLTQGSAHCLGPSPWRPCSRGRGQEGARNSKAQPLPSPRAHLLPQSPGPQWEGQRQGRAAEWGPVAPPTALGQ